MEKLNTQVDEVLQVEEKLIQSAKRKRKRRFRRRLTMIVLLASLVALGVFYLMSDISHVKSLTVVGNHIYTEGMILEKANLSYDSSFVLSNSWWIEHNLKKDPLIEKVNVSKNMQGGIEVNVEEKMVIGYLQNDPHSLLIQNEGLVHLEEMDESLIHNIPRISALSSEQLVELDAAFKNVEPEFVYMISEILPFSTSYDQEMIQLVMLDGNRVNTSYRGIELINSYKDILAQLEGTHVCLYVDEFSGNIIKENGDCTPNLGTGEESLAPESDENVSENVEE